MHVKKSGYILLISMKIDCLNVVYPGQDIKKCISSSVSSSHIRQRRADLSGRLRQCLSCSICKLWLDVLSLVSAILCAGIDMAVKYELFVYTCLQVLNTPSLAVLPTVWIMSCLYCRSNLVYITSRLSARLFGSSVLHPSSAWYSLFAHARNIPLHSP